MLDVTLEMTPSGARGGYLVEEGKNQAEMSLMVAFLPQGGRLSPCYVG